MGIIKKIKFKEALTKLIIRKNKTTLLIIAGILIFILTAFILIFSILSNKNHENYNVIFDSSGGNVNFIEPKLIDGKLEEPIPPTKNGYVFVEWQVNGVSYDFTQKVSSDIVLVAVWERLADTEFVKLIFDSNGGNFVDSIEIIKSGAAVMPLNPTRAGYTFAGWYFLDQPFDFFTLVEEDTFLVAKWEKGENVSVENPNFQETTNVSFSELKGTWYLEGYSCAGVEFTVDVDDPYPYAISFNFIGILDNFVIYPQYKDYPGGTPSGYSRKTGEEIIESLKSFGLSIKKINNTLLISLNNRVLKFVREPKKYDLSKYDSTVGTWYFDELLSDATIKISKSTEGVYSINSEGFDLNDLKFYENHSFSYTRFGISEYDILSNNIEFDKYQINRAGEDLHIGSGSNIKVFKKAAKVIPYEQIKGKWYALGTNNIFINVHYNGDVYNIVSENIDMCSLKINPTSYCGRAQDSSLLYLEKRFNMRLEKGVLTLSLDGEKVSFIRDKSIVKVSNITLDNTSLNIKIGETNSLYASVAPFNADNKAIIWEALDNSVIKILSQQNNSLNFKGIREGSTKIIAKSADGNTLAECVITVTHQSTSGIAINIPDLSMYYKDKSTLTATVYPNNATNKNVTWKSSNTSVVKVNANGELEGVGIGSAVITATTEDGSYKATSNVTVSYKPIAVTAKISFGYLFSGEFTGSYIGLTISASGGSEIYTYSSKIYRNNILISEKQNELSNEVKLTPAMSGEYYADVIVKDSTGNELHYTSPLTTISF